MARPKKNRTAEGAVAVAESPAAPKVSGVPALWWYGMLPATSSVPFPIPTNEPDDNTGEYYKLVNYDPLDLWAGKAGKFKGERIFVAKLRAYSGVGAGGVAFNAFSDHVSQYAGQVIRQSFPGTCKVMTDDEVSRSVEGIRANFVRFKLGVDEQSSVTHHQNVEIWDTRLGTKPPNMTPAQWEQYKGSRAIDVCPPFSAHTDVWLDEFVYLIRLDVDWNKWPKREFFRDPHSFYKRVLPSMEEFFQSPPPSIAEAFPREA